MGEHTDDAPGDSVEIEVMGDIPAHLTYNEQCVEEMERRMLRRYGPLLLVGLGASVAGLILAARALRATRQRRVAYA